MGAIPIESSVSKGKKVVRHRRPFRNSSTFHPLFLSRAWTFIPPNPLASSLSHLLGFLAFPPAKKNTRLHNPLVGRFIPLVRSSLSSFFNPKSGRRCFISPPFFFAIHVALDPPSRSFVSGTRYVVTLSPPPAFPTPFFFRPPVHWTCPLSAYAAPGFRPFFLDSFSRPTCSFTDCSRARWLTRLSWPQRPCCSL